MNGGGGGDLSTARLCALPFQLCSWLGLRSTGCPNSARGRGSDRVRVSVGVSGSDRVRGGNGDSVAEKVRDIGHWKDNTFMIACSD